MRRMSVWALGLFAGCRDYQEPIASEVCQPYPLACADCRFDDDVADSDGRHDDDLTLSAR